MASDVPKIVLDPKIDSYYSSFDTLFWFDMVLGGARHFGFYEKGTKNPFPFGRSIMRMEEELFKALRLPASSKVLDAGCGAGHVSQYMSQKGLHVMAIDVVKRHIRLTEKTAAKKSKLGTGSIEVRYMDYHHLEPFEDNSFDGVYTIEAFVHAADPDKVLAGFYRILKPGGHIAMHEYENDVEHEGNSTETAKRLMRQVNEGFSMPTHAISSSGALKSMLERAGFVDVEVHDLSENVRPMTGFNYCVTFVPFYITKFLGLEKYFINAVAGVQLHRNLKLGLWKYLQVTAKKPGELVVEEAT